MKVLLLARDSARLKAELAGRGGKVGGGKGELINGAEMGGTHVHYSYVKL